MRFEAVIENETRHGCALMFPEEEGGKVKGSVVTPRGAAIVEMESEGLLVSGISDQDMAVLKDAGVEGSTKDYILEKYVFCDRFEFIPDAENAHYNRLLNGARGYLYDRLENGRPVGLRRLKERQFMEIGAPVVKGALEISH
jgi:hypothetical protein